MADQRVTVLDSGLTVVTETVPDALSIAAGVWVGVGSRDEPAPIAGVSHFLEHLMFKGTPTRASHDIARGVDRVGGDFNAFTTKEYTAYYCRVPARHDAMCLELLGDVMCRPLLDRDDLANERMVILEELAMDDDAPDDVAHRLFAAQVFLGHPLGRETAGHRDTVQMIAVDDVRGFFESYYHAESMVVTVASPHPHDSVVRAVGSAFADVARSGDRPIRQAPDAVGESVQCVDDTEQVHVVLGCRSMARRDEGREALDVVNHVLGGGLSSRLFDQVREKRGLAYSVYSGVSAYSDGGAFQMYVGTQPQHVREVTGLMTGEIDALQSDGITDDELDIAKGYLTGAFELGLEDTGARMARNGSLMMAYGEILPVADQVAKWAAVDHDAVDAVIGSVFGAPLLSVTVGPAH